MREKEEASKLVLSTNIGKQLSGYKNGQIKHIDMMNAIISVVSNQVKLKNEHAHSESYYKQELDKKRNQIENIQKIINEQEICTKECDTW